MKLKLHLFKKELFYYLFAHALGIYAAVKLFPTLSQQLSGKSFNDDNFILFAAIFLVVLVLITISKKKAWFYRIFLILVVFLGSQSIFAIFLNPLSSYVAAIFLVTLMLLARSLLIQNTAITLAIAGIGGIIGLSFSPTAAIIALVAFSFYDIIAVYKTKHMVKMAEGMIESGAIFGIVVTSKKPKEFMILGSGDILLPLLLASSVSVTSIVSAIMVSAFSAFGLLVTHLLFSNQVRRRPMAALPPIATFAIIGYLVSVLI